MNQGDVASVCFSCKLGCRGLAGALWPPRSSSKTRCVGLERRPKPAKVVWVARDQPEAAGRESRAAPRGPGSCQTRLVTSPRGPPPSSGRSAVGRRAGHIPRGVEEMAGIPPAAPRSASGGRGSRSPGAGGGGGGREWKAGSGSRWGLGGPGTKRFPVVDGSYARRLELPGCQSPAPPKGLLLWECSHHSLPASGSPDPRETSRRGPCEGQSPVPPETAASCPLRCMVHACRLTGRLGPRSAQLSPAPADAASGRSSGTLHNPS